LTAVVIANVWRGIPFFTISYMSALAGISGDIYESAKIDGSGAVRTMFAITIPMIKDTIIITTLLRTIWTFNAVDLIISLTDGDRTAARPRWRSTSCALSPRASTMDMRRRSLRSRHC
jgi:multiple sugar transport system permease protein